MRFLSLFSGIEAASCAWLPLGWECAAVCEIEPFPCAVLKDHYPEVPNLGDVTKITREQVEALGHIDLLVGGFPCQDLSVAGKRAGLRNDDGSSTRSGLFFTGMQIADWANAQRVLVENVPGIFSSNKGRDFAAVVGKMAGCGFDVPRDGWQNAGFVVGPRGLVEWATLDAQYFGVPQRRRRVFIIRDSGDWTCRPPIFLERHSLSGNTPPRREAGQSVAGTFTARAKSGGWGQDPNLAAGGYMQPWPMQVAPTLDAHYGDKMGLENQHINAGGGLFVTGRIALPECGRDGSSGLGIGDADSYHRGSL